MANILVVDDDEAVTNSLRKFFGSEGHVVVVASDGLEALAILNDLMVDVALIDIVMPTVDGLTLMRRLQKDHPDVKLVVMSGFDDVMDLAGRELSAHLSIRKPFTLEEMKEVLNEALSPDSAAGSGE